MDDMDEDGNMVEMDLDSSNEDDEDNDTDCKIFE